MSKYRVKVLGVQGLNNKVFGPGEIVLEANFPAGNAKKLEQEGKLELITVTKKTEVEKETVKESEKKVSKQK